MIDHVGLEVADLDRSAAFYDAVLGRLGARRLSTARGDRLRERRAAAVDRRPRAPAGAGFGHVALGASGRAAVDATHAAGLAAGGADAGARAATGLRPALLRRLPPRPGRAPRGGRDRLGLRQREAQPRGRVRGAGGQPLGLTGVAVGA